MDIRFGILLSLLLCLVALPTGVMRACCTDTQTEKTTSEKKSCCGDSAGQSHQCSSDTGTCAIDRSNGDCSDDGGCGGGCQCPGCGTVCAHFSALTTSPDIVLLSHPLSETVKKQAFYFAEHMPEAVFLPIWQPPQLAA